MLLQFAYLETDVVFCVQHSVAHSFETMTQNKDLHVIIPKQFRIIEKNSGVCVLRMGKIVRVKFSIKGIFHVWRNNIFHTATLPFYWALSLRFKRSVLHLLFKKIILKYLPLNFFWLVRPWNRHCINHGRKQ